MGRLVVVGSNDADLGTVFYLLRDVVLLRGYLLGERVSRGMERDVVVVGHG
jgi:hypothetical protein